VPNLGSEFFQTILENLEHKGCLLFFKLKFHGNLPSLKLQA
jgi:hypothetical protein